jgi:thiosulfate/3-mercaptopyruvate sulfurtransferase
MERVPGRVSDAIVVGLAALAIACGGTAAEYANPRLLIETGELAGLLARPEIRIVDLRADPERGEAQYRAAHIPAAVYLSFRQLDDPQANAEGYPVRPERAADLFGRLGIDQETTVIAYDDAGGLYAARLFFVLEFYGHTRTRLLNGGLGKWRKEGRPLARGITRVEPKRFIPRARRELLATAEEVRAGLGQPEVCLIDARSPAEYAGTDVRATRGGRIPGAGLVDWTTTLNSDETFKSADALRAIFEVAGVRPDRQIITYCQSGIRAAHDYFALRLLGYAKVKIYDGSWNEWGNDARLPVER